MERLYAAVEALDDTVGGAREDVLDRLFARFFVGKEGVVNRVVEY